ncbi:uncharacterized protein G2W53_044681 [Senna tora]|uniref:Uncharacterized protein n=1 Tax=Senna tora TaxID=362788 RepID=A0A834VX05_9FABA|nr:uncharacterized protein G2W53_044681 [Senna tora]
MAVMMIKEHDLIESFRDMSLTWEVQSGRLLSSERQTKEAKKTQKPKSRNRSSFGGDRTEKKNNHVVVLNAAHRRPRRCSLLAAAVVLSE